MMWPILNWQRKAAMNEDLEHGAEDETSSGSGVTPTVITVLSSASPSVVMISKQSSSEDHPSIVDEETPTPYAQDEVIQKLSQQRCQDEAVGSPLKSVHENAVDGTLIKFGV